MAWPATPLAQVIELYLSGAWTAITSLVYRQDRLTITRGRSDESQNVERSTCKALVNNRSGNFSPRNPVGTYYGQIGRNTPIRARLTPASEAYLLQPVESDLVSCPDTANLSITGDIDVRTEIRPDDTSVFAGLCNKWTTAGNQRSWALVINANKTLTFYWSNDGTAVLSATSTVAVSFPAGNRIAVRVTLDVDNGAAGRDVKFYTASTIGGSYSQLGATVTTGGVTSIFNSTASQEVGRSNQGGVGLVGRTYAFEVYQGIAGTIRANLDFDSWEPGVSTYTDPQTNLWTISGDASVLNPGIRFRGEVAEWPQRWDVTGRDVRTPIEAAGILRRLTQGSSPLRSTLYRGTTSLATLPKAYWPCEDGEDATSIAAGLAGGVPMTVVGTPAMAQFDGFKCSAPLPLATGQEWKGTVPTYTGTGSVQVWFLLQVPTTTGSATSGQGIISIYTTGTITRWDLVYEGGGGDLRLKGLDAAGATVFDSGVIDFNIDKKLVRAQISLAQNGANIDWAVNTHEFGTLVIGGTGGTINTQTVSRCTRVVVNPGKDLGDLVAGHISVHSEIRQIADLASETNAYLGERAGTRLKRLCAEEGIPFRAVGVLAATANMGYQLPDELVALLREAATADGGILYEPRDMFGLAYRTRESLYNQAAVLALDYTAKHLSGIEPTDDDQQVRNDVTVQRIGGSSARAVKTSGALSTAAPPGGIGKYDEEVPMSLYQDSTLADRAGWLLWLGTVDEARYPVLDLDLARSPFVASSTLMNQAQDLDIGDRLTVDHPPAWLPPDQISQLAQGFTEVMANFTHTIAVNCSPESPWSAIGIYDSSGTRYTSDGSTLNSGITSGATSLSVATPSGPLWSITDGSFDLRIGGEVMTVTNITGASSPQTFTVTRSVNGVVKSHSAGAAVELDKVKVYAI